MPMLWEAFPEEEVRACEKHVERIRFLPNGCPARRLVVNPDSPIPCEHLCIAFMHAMQRFVREGILNGMPPDEIILPAIQAANHAHTAFLRAFAQKG